MGEYTSYYLYQKYEQREGQQPLPVYPPIYSYNGQGTMTPVVKMDNDPNCGYVPPSEAIYRWYQIPISQDYICDECIEPIYRWVNSGTTCVGYDKYQRAIKQVSYDSGSTWQNVSPEEYSATTLIEADSPDCGYIEPIYRWVNLDPSTDYYCSGTTKYYKQQRQVSYDSGSTWENVSPAEYQWGSSAQSESTDCGYIPPTPTSGGYLTFVATESGTFTFTPKNSNVIQYSLNSGSTWVTSNSVSVNNGDKVMWKGTMTSLDDGIGKFSSTSTFTAEGNIMSLLYGDNFEGKTDLESNNWVFYSMFYGCSRLTSAENLILPATELTSYCYCNMFRNCTSLVTAPQLPATTLANNCYESMFSSCTSLTTAPQLPASTLASECYAFMFGSCTSLTTAPELLATTLVYRCYANILSYCPNINYIKCLATDISASQCTYYWLAGVSSSGTFVKASSMTSWTTGNNGIPSGWTVQNA